MEEEPLNQDDIEVLLIIKNILAFIPLILLFLISLLFWYLKKIKKRMIYMNIFYLMLIEICYLICIVLPYNYNEPDSSLCIAESLLINFFTHCKYVWCFLMTRCPCSMPWACRSADPHVSTDAKRLWSGCRSYSSLQAHCAGSYKYRYRGCT